MILRARRSCPSPRRRLKTARSSFPEIKSAPSARGRICDRNSPAKKFSISAKSSCCPASSTPIAISITPTWPGNCRRQKHSPTGFRSSPPPKPRGVIPTTPAPGCTARNMLLKTGTTTVADIEAMPDLLPEVWDATPLRVFSFLEMTGIRAQRKPKEILARSRRKN